MKITEIITESVLTKSAKAAIPNLEVYDDLDNSSPYHMYRFGVALAGAPDLGGDDYGPTRSNLITIGYSDADQEIIDATKKSMGRKSTRITNKYSREVDAVNKQSPVQPKGPVKRKSR
jgi:hypothetical protein